MNGLDKMTQQILQEAQQQADQLLIDAKEDAQKSVDQARQESEAWAKEAAVSLEKELDEFRARAASSRDLERRRAILEAKQEIIAEMIEKTCERMRQAGVEEYFETLKRMFEKFCHGEEGQMYLSAQDLARVPQEFRESVMRIAAQKGGSIEVQDVPGRIADGFLLVYGGIEENCTFEAVIESDRSRLQDQVNAMLWRECNG